MLISFDVRMHGRHIARVLAHSCIGIWLLASCTADVPASAESAAQPLADRAFLASENLPTSYVGNVAYGANGAFYYRNMAGPFSCDSQTFGGDPIWGVVKACYAMAPGDHLLASENVATSYFGNVAYGANNSFYYRTMAGPFTCNSQTFGGDPLSGVVKSCYAGPWLSAPKMATHFVNDSPSGSYTWSNGVQGLAHDDSHWYISQTGTIWRVPFASGLGSDSPAGSLTVDLPDVWYDSNPGTLNFFNYGNPHYVSDTHGYNHIGDIDFHSFGNAATSAHVLFVPLTLSKSSSPPIPRLAIFNADTLQYVASTTLPAAATVDIMGAGGWVAVRPGVIPSDPVSLWFSANVTQDSGLLSGLPPKSFPTAFVAYTFDPNHKIVSASGDWVNPQPTTAASSQLELGGPSEAYAQIGGARLLTDMYSMQGGTFNEDGSLLYTSNGYCDISGKIHVFRVDYGNRGGMVTSLATESFNPVDGNAQTDADRNFTFTNHPKDQICPGTNTSFWEAGIALFLGRPDFAAGIIADSWGDPDANCFCVGEEAEGLDYFDTRGRSIPGIPDSQLHTFLLSNDAGDDHIWLKNFAFVNTPPSAWPDTNLALGHPAYQSSDLGDATANRANDGNTDGNFWDGSVSHTNNGWNGEPWNGIGQPQDYPGQYWFVDLETVRTVDGVNIYNRTDCCSERLSNYNLLAQSDALGGWFVISNHAADDTTGVPFISETFDVPVQTRYIMIAKTDQDYLQLAEVQVMGH